MKALPVLPSNPGGGKAGNRKLERAAPVYGFRSGFIVACFFTSDNGFFEIGWEIKGLRYFIFKNTLTGEVY